MGLPLVHALRLPVVWCKSSSLDAIPFCLDGNFFFFFLFLNSPCDHCTALLAVHLTLSGANLQSSSHVAVHSTISKLPDQHTGCWCVTMAWQNTVQKVSSMAMQPVVLLQVGYSSRWEIPILPWTAQCVPVLWHFCMAQSKLDSLLSSSSLTAFGP